MADVFPDFALEIFEQRYHFDLQHRIEPDRLAALLLRTWAGAEAARPAGAIDNELTRRHGEVALSDSAEET